MSEVGGNNGGPFPNETAFVGEAVAGEAAATLKLVKSLVKGISVNTFDLAEALHKVKSHKFYAPKHNTFGEYAKSLDLKTTKAYYLVKLVEVMETTGIPRTQYEPLGIAKLRLISRLDLLNAEGLPNSYNGIPATLLVKDLVEQAATLTPEMMELKVKTIQGLVGENSQVWENISMTVGQQTKWHEAVALAKMNIGSVGKDDDGQFKDAGVGACAEVIAVSYLLDPNNHPEG